MSRFTYRNALCSLVEIRLVIIERERKRIIGEKKLKYEKITDRAMDGHT